MFITIDVVFHESSMYFSSKPELKGEYCQEIQTPDDVLKYDYHSFKIDNHRVKSLNESGNLDQKCDEQLEEPFESELEVTQSPLVIDPFKFEHLTNIPNQSSAEDLEPPRKQLPHQHTRGIPNPICEPKLSSKVNIP